MNRVGGRKENERGQAHEAILIYVAWRQPQLTIGPYLCVLPPPHQ